MNKTSHLVDILVLGGGYGTRLGRRGSSKDYAPKGLIDICGKPAIERTLDSFSDLFIDKIILETNNEGIEPYSNWLSTYSGNSKVELFCESLSTPDNCLGVLETIAYVANEKKFTKPILLLAPDNIFFENQDHLFNDLDNSSVRFLSYDVKSLIEARKYGVLNLKDSKVVHCEEKPTNPSSTIIRTACEIWKPKIFNLLDSWIEKGETDKMGDFIQYLIKSEVSISSCPVKGDWKDIGNKNDLNQTRTLWKQKYALEE